MDMESQEMLGSSRGAEDQLSRLRLELLCNGTRIGWNPGMAVTAVN